MERNFEETNEETYRAYLQDMIQKKETDVMHHQQKIQEIEQELKGLRADLEKLEK